MRRLHCHTRRYTSHTTQKDRWIPSAGVYPQGFVANATTTRVKKNETQDLTLIASPSLACTTSAVFTKNAFCAPPVQLSKIITQLASSSGAGVRALIVNSGCANACTGEKGLQDAKNMVQSVDSCLHLKSSHPQTLVMSTGVIGQPLQMEKILKGITEIIPSLGNTHEHWLNAARGIMTTDTFPKLKSQEYTIGSNTFRMAGVCKGAGMIHPNMATMLGAIFTDISISQPCLDAALKHAADRSFNAISVDGDTSTNDSLAIFANGAAGGVKITDLKSPEYEAFTHHLTAFASQLSELIVRDGEGATKFIEIRVKGAKTFQDAKTVASSIATSPLVKTAIYGKDANWGRIVCAVGYSGVFVIPDKVNLHFGVRNSSTKEDTLHLFKNGAPFDVDEAKAAAILEHEDLLIVVDLGLGDSEAHMYTCDFSHEYVSVNADYRS